MALIKVLMGLMVVGTTFAQICPFIWAPVCGIRLSDRSVRTFSNQCLLDNQQDCIGDRYRFLHSGECRPRYPDCGIQPYYQQQWPIIRRQSFVQIQNPIEECDNVQYISRPRPYWPIWRPQYPIYRPRPIWSQPIQQDCITNERRTTHSEATATATASSDVVESPNCFESPPILPIPQPIC